MDAKAADLIATHVKSIQHGFEQRAQANIAIAAAMRDLTLTRVSQAKSADEAQAVINSYVEGMMHW